MMETTSDEVLGDYLRESVSWDDDRVAQAHRGLRTAWRVAGAGRICAMTGGLALLFLMPLKRVDPFVVRVDNATGIVDVVPVYEGGAPLDQEISRYFIAHYITTCERFNFVTAENDYEECGAFHAAKRNQAWSALWSRNNPRSPLNVHKDGGRVRAQVESVSFFQRGNGVTDLAQVRYVKAERQSDSAAEQFTHWIATIRFVYTAPSKDPRLRSWNPLGFKVVEMISEPEVPAETK